MEQLDCVCTKSARPSWPAKFAEAVKPSSRAEESPLPGASLNGARLLARLERQVFLRAAQAARLAALVDASCWRPANFSGPHLAPGVPGGEHRCWLNEVTSESRMLALVVELGSSSSLASGFA